MVLTQMLRMVNGNLNFVQQELKWNVIDLCLLGQLV
jgi:hypothetical protein